MKSGSTTCYTTFESPIGCLLLTSDDSHLTAVHLLKDGEHFSPPAHWKEEGSHDPLAEARKELEAYFRGELRTFTVPLRPEGTEFQRRVWSELERIPYGTTISYGELARRVGNANASRAVGMANGKNPLMIVVPCHRVIGSTGKLTGFSAGLTAKERLLDLEQRSAPANAPGAGVRTMA